MSRRFFGSFVPKEATFFVRALIKRSHFAIRAIVRRRSPVGEDISAVTRELSLLPPRSVRRPHARLTLSALGFELSLFSELWSGRGFEGLTRSKSLFERGWYVSPVINIRQQNTVDKSENQR